MEISVPAQPGSVGKTSVTVQVPMPSGDIVVLPGTPPALPPVRDMFTIVAVWADSWESMAWALTAEAAETVAEALHQQHGYQIVEIWHLGERVGRHATTIRTADDAD